MHVTLCRLCHVLVIVTAVLVGTPGQQLLAVAVAGLLVSRRVAIAHVGRPSTTVDPVGLPVPAAQHP